MLDDDEPGFESAMQQGEDDVKEEMNREKSAYCCLIYLWMAPLNVSAQGMSGVTTGCALPEESETAVSTPPPP